MRMGQGSVAGGNTQKSQLWPRLTLGWVVSGVGGQEGKHIGPFWIRG